MPVDKLKVEQGRQAVDAYREAHRQLHLQPWDKDVPKKHTPLLDELSLTLRKQCGFNTLGGFFTASEELNAQELVAGTIASDEVWK